MNHLLDRLLQMRCIKAKYSRQRVKEIAGCLKLLNKLDLVVAIVDKTSIVQRRLRITTHHHIGLHHTERHARECLDTDPMFPPLLIHDSLQWYLSIAPTCVVK